MTSRWKTKRARGRQTPFFFDHHPARTDHERIFHDLAMSELWLPPSFLPFILSNRGRPKLVRKDLQSNLEPTFPFRHSTSWYRSRYYKSPPKREMR
jgi:hypothetical protein